MASAIIVAVKIFALLTEWGFHREHILSHRVAFANCVWVYNAATERKSMHPATQIPEPLWTFRQHELTTSEFNTALAHFYRAEIQRSNTWRTRLDPSPLDAWIKDR
jgi:uncharacterized membrane protein